MARTNMRATRPSCHRELVRAIESARPHDGPHRQPQVALWFEGVSNRIEVARALSPVMYIHSRVPAVITIHGKRDHDVPYGQSVPLHHVLDHVGTPNRLVTMQAGHGDFTPVQASYAYDSVF